MIDYNEYLEYAICMAKLAEEVHLKYFRSDNLSMQTKINDYDVVTAADKESDSVIIEMIRSKYPNHGIIAEESGVINEKSEWNWIIDPLDGTTNFSQGLPVFCVSIALEYKGETIVGVVYAAYLDELFYAIKGMGAFFNGKKISCSDKNNFSESVLATGVPDDKLENSDNNLKEIGAVAPYVRGIRRMGSAAIDLAYVGGGFLDGYWELNLKHWDVAAGQLIALEGGAIIKSIRPDRNYSIMAASPLIYYDLLGMAVDANVLIFERIREELRKGRTVINAIDIGYSKALSAIIDSNLTSLIAAVVLFQFGTGPIKGFAITLSIGLIASMFTAIFVTRTIFMSFMYKRTIKHLSI